MPARFMFLRPVWKVPTADAEGRASDASKEAFSVPDRHLEVEPMKNPLDSLWGTVIAGFILTVLLYFLAASIVSHSVAPGGGV